MGQGGVAKTNAFGGVMCDDAVRCEKMLKSLRRIFQAFFYLPHKTEEQFDAMDEAAIILRTNKNKLTPSKLTCDNTNQQPFGTKPDQDNKEEDKMPARSTETLDELQDQASSLMQEVDTFTGTIETATKERQIVSKKLRSIQGKIVTIQLREKQGAAE